MSFDPFSLVTLAVKKIGYLGIFLGMFLESTIIPIPSELVMVPAGIAASKGQMNLAMIIFWGVAGNLAGAVASYYFALIYGKKYIEKIGIFFLVKPESLNKIDNFFEKYGSISVFMGRLLPGFRHFISIPAGIGRMNIKKFIFYTALGSTIWDSVLALTGYFIGENNNLITEKTHDALLIILILAVIFFLIYIFRKPAWK